MTAPDPAAPPRRRRPLSPLAALWRTRRDLLSVWPDEAFAAGFLAQRFLFRWLFVANSPETVRHVLVTHAAAYPKSATTRQALLPLIGDSLFLTSGEVWARQRRRAQPAFSAARLRAFAAIAADESQAMLARWDRLGDGAGLDVAAAMSEVTATIVCRALFGNGLGDRAGDLLGGLSAYQEAVGRLYVAEMMGVPPRLLRMPAAARQAVARIDAVIGPIVAGRRAAGIDPGGDRGDFLSLLLESRDEQGRPVPAKEVRDEVAFMLLAGHETTANALSWAWYLLSQHPEAEARLHDEVDRVLGGPKGGRAPGFADVPALAYTRQIVDEALRLYPPVPVLSRQAAAEDEIAGRRVPAGSIVLVAPWLLHRHRALWRRPDAFEPERFSPERSARRPPLAYIPFGAGPRSCLGAAFGLTEAVLLLAGIARRYRLALSPGRRVEPVGRLTLRPKGGLPMRLVRR